MTVSKYSLSESIGPSDYHFCQMVSNSMPCQIVCGMFVQYAPLFVMTLSKYVPISFIGKHRAWWISLLWDGIRQHALPNSSQNVCAWGRGGFEVDLESIWHDVFSFSCTVPDTMSSEVLYCIFRTNLWQCLGTSQLIISNIIIFYYHIPCINTYLVNVEDTDSTNEYISSQCQLPRVYNFPICIQWKWSVKG